MRVWLLAILAILPFDASVKPSEGGQTHCHGPLERYHRGRKRVYGLPVW